MEGKFCYYHIPGLNESTTEDDLEKSYRKLALQSHPYKNKHPQVYAAFHMIQEVKKVLEETLRHNDTLRRNQVRKEDLQRQ